MTTCLGKELFIRFTVHGFRDRLSVYVNALLSLFGFEVDLWVDIC